MYFASSLENCQVRVGILLGGYVQYEFSFALRSKLVSLQVGDARRMVTPPAM